MPSSLPANALRLAVAVAVAVTGACSSGGGAGGPSSGAAGVSAPTGVGGNSVGGSGAAGVGGVTGAAGTATAGVGAPSGAAGTSSGAAGAAPSGAAGTAPWAAAGATGAAAGTNGAAGVGGGAGGAGSVGADDLTKVLPTTGCGKAPGQALGSAVMGTIMTMGTKDADCADSKCGAWAYTRTYFVTLPAGYDRNKPYPIVFQGSGCGGDGRGVYPLNGLDQPLVNNTVIGVGLSPPPVSIGHVVEPGPGGAASGSGIPCFDDKEGDDSVEWIYYENLYDKLSAQFCIDRNRVFAAGFSTGAWLANELGCRYAGDAKRAVRGVLPNTGGLPDNPKYAPTCTTKPMAGMWVHEIGDVNNPWANNEIAISRAMKVNGCTMGTSYETAPLVSFPIGGGNADTTCKKIVGCPALYPLVVCLLPGNMHVGHDSIVNPGFATFIKMFEAPPFLTP